MWLREREEVVKSGWRDRMRETGREREREGRIDERSINQVGSMAQADD